MKTIRVKKGYNLKIVGSPSHLLKKAEKPTYVALQPEHIPFVKPRLKIAKKTNATQTSNFYLPAAGA
jgi:Na+-transporting NADH:ubiquinone oxidoreductase subunit NqrA